MNQSVTKLALLAVTAAAFTASTLGPAQAQGSVAPSPFVAQMPEAQPDIDRVSPGVALTLSLLGTAVGYGALIGGLDNSQNLMLVGYAGIVAGPSIGHFYTGEYGRGLLTTGVRGLGFLAMGLGASLTLRDCWDDEPCANNGPAIFWAGALTTIGTTIYSIVDSRRSARRVNERNRRKLALTPAPVVGPDRSMGMGMTLSGSF